MISKRYFVIVGILAILLSLAVGYYVGASGVKIELPMMIKSYEVSYNG